MPNPANAPAPLVDTIAHYISELILSGELLPGARVNEAEMAERFGVSRGPVREAIAILSSGFIVDVYPRRGAFVADLDGETVKQLCEYAAYQFASLTRELMRNIHSPEQLDVFQPLLDKVKTLAGAEEIDLKKFQNACYALETQASEMIQNRFLLEAISQMGLAVRRVELLAFEDVNTARKHAEFLDATVAAVRDGTLNDALEKHYRDHYEEIWKQLVRQGKIG